MKIGNDWCRRLRQYMDVLPICSIPERVGSEMKGLSCRVASRLLEDIIVIGQGEVAIVSLDLNYRRGHPH
ncbi:hypothetical protein [Cobetia sp. L2A1]|uniref:hypothetical protein n=1 Tax=Cobetia sp. L2A1 TaxID=2686360 RepID=UPI00131AAC92|nr:hypothetical protein [Cobetia sp. L2A1]